MYYSFNNIFFYLFVYLINSEDILGGDTGHWQMRNVS